MLGTTPNPHPSGAAAFYHGRNYDSEVLASGFSPRVFNLHPVGEHPSTAHKRQTSTTKGDHLPSVPTVGTEVAITIPAAATWQDTGAPSFSRAGQVEERGQLSQPIPAEISKPLPEKARPKVKVDTREGWDRDRKGTKKKGPGVASSIGLGDSQIVQSLRKLPGGAVAAIQSSLNAVLWRSGGSAPNARKANLNRAGSIVRSPTLKNIHSLSSLPKDSEGGSPKATQRGGFTWDSRIDYQTLLSMALFALVLFLWLCKGRPLISMLHIFPEEQDQKPPGSIWVELIALCFLLVIVAALVRSAFPHLYSHLRTYAAEAWDLYVDPGKLPTAFTFGWGRKGAPSTAWGKQGWGTNKGIRHAPVAAPPFGDKRKSSFNNRGSWEYLGAAKTPEGEGTPRGYDVGVPSSPVVSPSPSRVLHCGVQIYSNGDRYEGEFHQGKCSGSGVYIFAASGRYEGDWVEGKYDGCGIETWLRGSRYRGQYRKGLREGYGVYRFYTGDVYAGMWAKGQSHGVGLQTCSDGSKYVGEFQWGAKHGVGKYTFRNGDCYSGEYFADKMHGYGWYEFSNGHRYEGAWHEGRKQGLGVYTFRNGEERAGHWHLGALETRSTRSTGGTPSSPNAVNHSRVLHAVQEARRAAAKAEHVVRVEDRVSKAVSAANRAAVAARVAAAKAVQISGAGGVGSSASVAIKVTDPGDPQSEEP